MNLHSIPSPTPTATVWYSLYGGNSRRLLGGTAHLYIITRTPPQFPLHHRARPFSSVWPPEPPNTQILTPLCGRLPTRSRFPLACPTSPAWPNLCHTCSTQTTQRPTYHTNLIATDPWYSLPPDTRLTTLDPISGR